MKSRFLTLLAFVAILPGCAGVVAYDASRKNAGPLFERVMAESYPDLPSDRAADCVIKAMTIPETASFGVADTSALNSERRTKILGIAARPKAQTCLLALTAETTS